MRKLIMWNLMSLDGFFEGPNRDISWHSDVWGPELEQLSIEQGKEIGALLFGRVTYELMAGYWPTADEDPASTAPEVEFARIWRDMPKIVFSNTLQRADWNTELVRDVVPEQITDLKAQPGGDLLLGGADVGQTFMRYDLIDEYRIYVHPVVIGEGKRLFQSPDLEFNLKLAETRAFSSGVVLLRYVRPETSATS